MLAASAQIITPFQPKLIRINGIPHLITTADSSLPLEMPLTHQTPSSIPPQTTPYWRASTHSQAPSSSRQKIALAPSVGNEVYVFSKYFQERKSACTVGFHPAISSTSFRRNIASLPHPVPAIRLESSGFRQLDIKPFHVEQFPETELLSIESLLALITSFDQDPQRVNIPVMKVSGSVLNSVLIDRESTITNRLLETEIYSTFIGSNQKNSKQDSTTRSAQTDSSTTSSTFEPSDASESDTLEIGGVLEGGSESDSETDLEESMNIDDGLVQPVTEEQTTTISSQGSSSSSSSSSTSSIMAHSFGFFPSPFSMMPPPVPRGGMAGPPPLAGTAQIGASQPSGVPAQQIGVFASSPGLGNQTDIPLSFLSHVPAMMPYASTFLPFPRRAFPHFPDEITDASSLWSHVRNLVEFVLREVNSNLQLSFIELLQRVLPEENHSWISSLGGLYQKRLTWFERNQLLSFSEEMMALSNGIMSERIFFQISSINLLSSDIRGKLRTQRK